MAKLIAKAQGNRQEVHRLSNRDAKVEIGGFNYGIRVEAEALEGNNIKFTIYETNMQGKTKVLLKLIKSDEYCI